MSLKYGKNPAHFAALYRPHRLAWPRTLPFQGSNTGSNPVGDTSTYALLANSCDTGVTRRSVDNASPTGRQVFRCSKAWIPASEATFGSGRPACTRHKHKTLV